jgi:hypothetical protein
MSLALRALMTVAALKLAELAATHLLIPADSRPAVGRAWMPPCISALKRARDQYSRKGSRPIILKITTQVGRKNKERGECGDHVVDSVAFEVPASRDESGLPGYGGSIETRSGIDDRPTQPWTQVAWMYGRHDHGRTAEIDVMDPASADGPDFFVAFQHALDECLAAAPASPGPPPESTVAELRAQCSGDSPGVDFPSCQAAELAAQKLERTCAVDGHRPGITQPALHQITALGTAATPILMRLARSSNPAARAVAAIGLGEIKTDVARAELGRLASDRTTADTILMGGGEAVSEFAKRALGR